MLLVLLQDFCFKHKALLLWIKNTSIITCLTLIRVKCINDLEECNWRWNDKATSKYTFLARHSCPDKIRSAMPGDKRTNLRVSIFHEHDCSGPGDSEAVRWFIAWIVPQLLWEIWQLDFIFPTVVTVNYFYINGCSYSTKSWFWAWFFSVFILHIWKSNNILL